MVGAIVGIHDAAVRDGPAFAPRHREQRHGVGDGIADIAAAEDRRIGKAVDEVHDQQPERPGQLQRIAEALALIRADFLVHHDLSSG
ncbi:hypothetical protein D3C72_2148390 [compost metagenome]